MADVKKEDGPSRAEQAQHIKAAVADAKASSGWVIAPGKSISCRRGNLAPGATVTPRDFIGPRGALKDGEATMDEFKSRGFVIPEPQDQIKSKSRGSAKVA